MLVPPHFHVKDTDEILSFIRAHAFPMVVSTVAGLPEASHLPVIVASQDPLVLETHMNKKNPLCDVIVNQEILVCFHGAHDYISPRWYGEFVSVPTWNYLAVHVRGVARLIDNQQAAFDLLVRAVDTFEAELEEPWSLAEAEPLARKMLPHIQAYKIDVTDIQAQFKLSQNRPQKAVEGVIAELDDRNAALAQQMRSILTR